MLRASLRPVVNDAVTGNTLQERAEDLQKTLQKTLQKKDLDIIRLMRENPSISTAAIAEKLKVSRQTVATHVKSLQDVGVISRVGPDKGGRWVVNLRK